MNRIKMKGEGKEGEEGVLGGWMDGWISGNL